MRNLVNSDSYQPTYPLTHLPTYPLTLFHAIPFPFTGDPDWCGWVGLRPAKIRYVYRAMPVRAAMAYFMAGLIAAGEINPSIVPATTSSGTQPPTNLTASSPRDLRASARDRSPGRRTEVPIRMPAPPAI